MEKIQKINTWFIFLACATTLYSIMHLLYLPILLIMSIAVPHDAGFFETIAKVSIGQFLYRYSIVIIIIFLIGLYFYFKRHYRFSIFFLFLTIIFSIILPMYSDAKAHKLAQESLYSFQKNEPPSGFLVPSKYFLIDGYQETLRQYQDVGIHVIYEKINADESKSTLAFHSYLSDKSWDAFQRKNVIHKFEHADRPGIVSEISYIPNSNIGDYLLLYDDGEGRYVNIMLRNVVKNDTYPIALKESLSRLERNLK